MGSKMLMLILFYFMYLSGDLYLVLHDYKAYPSSSWNYNYSVISLASLTSSTYLFYETY